MVDAVYIGFGEAGAALAVPGAAAYDVKTADPLARDEKYRDYAAAGIRGFDDAAGALAGAGLVADSDPASEGSVAAGVASCAWAR